MQLRKNWKLVHSIAYTEEHLVSDATQKELKEDVAPVVQRLVKLKDATQKELKVFL